MQVIESELIPTDSRKSFCRKAMLLTAKDGSVFLKSYSTIMAKVDPNGNVTRYSDYRSNTTNRHVKSFLETVNAKAGPKEFWNMPRSVETEELTLSV